jgi:hypothetical protein
LHAPDHPDDLLPTIPQLFPISNSSPTPPISIIAEMVAEAELMAAIAAQAFMNQSMYFARYPLLKNDLDVLVKIDMDAAQYDQALPK